MSQTPHAPRETSDGFDGFPRKRWNIKECRFLQEAGLLIPGKYELIEGDIVVKMPQGYVHLFLVHRLLGILAAVFGLNHVLSQGPVGIGRSDTAETAPEPDVFVLREPQENYVARNGPSPASDVLLVVEVSVSTLTGDTSVKKRIYAGAGIGEYWVLDVEGRQLIVHRFPSGNDYASLVPFDENQAVSPLASTASLIAVRDLSP